MTIYELEKSIDNLPFGVPDGMLLRSGRCAYYLSDEPPPAGVWALLREQHPRSGLWPVFLQGHEEVPNHPWVDGDPSFPCARPPEDCDAETELRRQWNETISRNPSPEDVAEFVSWVSPFGREWPGLAPASPLSTSPDRVAEDFAERLINDADTRLGLMPLQRGADLPAVTGWWAGDEMDPGAASAILRSWEDRFGTRLILAGFDALVLSVAAPPTTLAAAQQVAAEHFAFCAETVGLAAGALSCYAEELIGLQHWSLRWDKQLPDWVVED